jgi:branched-chain amino acid transport system ATP-binding protein
MRIDGRCLLTSLPSFIRNILNIINEINKHGVTILLIEPNANMVLSSAHMGYVLRTGRITLSCPGKELLDNETVKAALLGT